MNPNQEIMNMGKGHTLGLIAFLLLCTHHLCAAPQPPVPPMPELGRVAFSERFDAGYTKDSGAELAVAGLGRVVESWSGYALERQGTVLPLLIEGVSGGRTNLFPHGAVRLWLKPDWSSASTENGQGPGQPVTVLEMNVAGQTQTAPVWALHISADGSLLYLLGTGAKESGVLLQAEINWTAGQWHQVVLNYTEQGTALAVDGEWVAEGSGVLAVPSSAAVLTVGSSVTGADSIEGEVEEVYGFGQPLKAGFNYTPYKDLAARGPLRAADVAYRAELAAKWKAARALKAQAEESGGGEMMLRLSGPSVDCVTNGPVYLTNVVCNFTTNDGWTIYFDIMGGETNSGPYDIFSTPAIVGNDVTNSVWTWLETAEGTCETHYFTNQNLAGSFYLLTLPGADRDGDGMYDGWEWKHFGTLAQTAGGDFDGDGVSNGAASTNLVDPNQIKFTLDFGTRFVNANSASGTILVAQGVPEQMAVLVNSTNFETAVWLPYQSNITASLGTTDGEYVVWVGLGGHAWDTERRWQGVTITRDTVPPQLFITQPLSNLTAQPIIQLQGYANEPLLTVRYDITNATGLQTNLAGYVTQQWLDTNTLQFTTNWWQCYDVILETNLNTITVRVTDLAGNETSTNLNLTLDYSSDTNAPTITVTWPEDNALVAGTNFTVRGQLNDGTASVVVNLGPNSIAGRVARDGSFEIPTVPLIAATNTLTLIATDAAGNSQTNTRVVRQSSETLTINPVSPSDLTQPTVTVSGTVGVSGQNVWVNGTAANVSGTDWLVNLTTPSDNVANFDVVTGPTLGNPTASQNTSTESPPQVRPSGYTEKFYVGQTDSCGAGWLVLADTTRNWSPADGPFESLGLSAWQNTDLERHNSQRAFDSFCFGSYTTGDRLVFKSQTKMELRAGGQAGPGETRLIRLLVAAAGYSSESLIGLIAGDVPLLAASLQLFGQAVTPTATNAYVGELFIERPAGSTTDLPVTFASGTSASFDFKAEDAKLKIYLGTNTTDIAGQTNEVIVGQKISLRCELSHPNTILSNFQWTIPGFAISNYVANNSVGIVYSNFPTSLSNVAFFWVDGATNRQIECSAMIGGQRVVGKTTFNILRPMPTYVYAQIRGVVAADTNYSEFTSYPYLHFGSGGNNPAYDGIAFGYTNAPTNPNISGDSYGLYFGTQVDNATDYKVNRRYPTGCNGERTIGNGVDNFARIPASITFNTNHEWGDSPGVPLTYPISWRAVADSFTHFWMFRPRSPEGIIDELTTIPVPLCKLSWDYSAAAKTNGVTGQYILLPNSIPTNAPPFNLQVQDTLDYPKWTNNINGLIPTAVPCYDEN